MVDTSEKGSKCEEMICETPTTPERSTSDGSNVRTCVTCGTSKTPLWRGGPSGPKSLCNACGIRSGKKIRALMGVTKKSKKTATNLCNSSDSCCTSSSGESTSTKNGDFANNKKLWVFGKDLGLKQKPRSSMKRSRVSEVERAAILLMALSCGSVYA